MLDANDIQIISKIVSDALAEERKHTEAMFAEERKHTEAMFAEERKHTEAMFAQQKEELRTEMLAISAQQKKEMHEDMMTIIESEVTPQFRILADAHEVLLERMTPPEEIEDIKTDIFILKEAVKNLGTRVKALQKAQ